MPAETPGRPSPFRRLNPLVALAAAACLPGAAAAGPPPELRKLHALIVVDTLSGLGEGVKVDGERVEHFLSRNLPRDRVAIRLITGKDVNAAGILGHYKNLKVGPDDALFFFYAGHGATDPARGHFLALNDLATKPLFRSDLRRAMEATHAGLVVIVTDCCSTVFRLPGNRRSVYADTGEAAEVHPVLRGLFYQSRGTVDVTAATGNSSLGDDRDGGVFTRTFVGLMQAGVERTDADRDGVVTWLEFFPRLQAETQRAFALWSQKLRARGEVVAQTHQKPFAFDLGGPPAVLLRNETGAPLRYEYRWNSGDPWQSATLEPRSIGRHPPPASGPGSPTLEVRFEGGKTSRLSVGRTYRFHETSDRDRPAPKPRDP